MSRLQEHAIAFYSALTVFVAVQATAAHSDIAARGDFAGLVKIGGGLGIGSVALMLLGTQWYILFNVIAGAMAIPTELKEVSNVFHFGRWERWRRMMMAGYGGNG